MKTPIPYLALSLVVSTLGYANSAVSEINGKLATAVGSFDSFDGNTVQGSVSIPIAEALGFQFDGYYADIEGNDFGGIGAHFFWRDNEVGLLGLSAGAIDGPHLKTYELSVEGEYYYKQFTFGARAGYAKIDYDFTVPFLDTDKGGAFGKAYIGFYALEDLWVSASVENRFENTYYGVDVEYQTPINGLSIFGNATSGNDDYEHAYVGLRYYFGSKKSLKGRHRRDDPKNMLVDMFTGIGSYGAEGGRRAKDYNEYLRREWNNSIGSGATYSGSTSLIVSGVVSGSGILDGELVLATGGTLRAGWNSNLASSNVFGGSLTLAEPVTFIDSNGIYNSIDLGALGSVTRLTSGNVFNFQGGVLELIVVE
ncbi:MAG: hypothetical protein ACSHX8_06810 [Opitutaceae bacterium]